MTRKALFERPSPLAAHSKPLHPSIPADRGQGAAPFRTVLSDDLNRQRVQNMNVPGFPARPPARTEPEPGLLLSLLNRFLSSIRRRGPVSKQLRLLETVPLGEKRFVALVSAEGHKFLIGGGSSGVSLLSSLDAATTPCNMSNDIEHSKAFGVPSLPKTIDIVERPKSFVELAGVQE